MSARLTSSDQGHAIELEFKILGVYILRFGVFIYIWSPYMFSYIFKLWTQAFNDEIQLEIWAS